MGNLARDCINNEMRRIKFKYCKKCVYFDGSCKKDKIYKKCFEKNERVLKNVGGSYEVKRP